MGVFTRQTLLKHKCDDSVKGLGFFFLWNIYFPLVLALDSMGTIHKLINKLTSVFYASVLLLIMNFVITLSK